MKFATGLVVAAIAVASASAATIGPPESGEKICPDACTDVYNPVTDEDGTTYPNECSMQAAKCKGGEKYEDLLEEYKRINGKSFGASRDADEDSNTDDSASDESDESGSDESDSTDGSAPKSYCPNISCPAVYQPVTDENGKMYPNKCAMEAAKCKGPRENVLDEYKRLYGRSFGASRDSGDEEDDDASGSTIDQLDVDSSDEGVIDGGKPKSSKKCADTCPDIMNPVCGSDGIKYSNPCELKVAACKYPELNIVEDASACSKITTEDDTILREPSKSLKLD